MLNGVNSLNIFLTLSSTRKEKIMLLLMLCLDAMLYSHNLILKFLGWKVLKICMQLTHALLNHFRNVVMARTGKSSICMMDFCFELTNFAFQIALFV